jgi:hypothetical protein
VLKISKKLLQFFPEVYIAEFYDNNFKLKMKKREIEAMSIGSLFSIFEDMVSFSNIFRNLISTSLSMEFHKQV